MPIPGKIVHALRCFLLHGYGPPKPENSYGRQLLLTEDRADYARWTPRSPAVHLWARPSSCGRLVERIAAEAPDDWNDSLINTNHRLWAYKSAHNCATHGGMRSAKTRVLLTSSQHLVPAEREGPLLEPPLVAIDIRGWLHSTAAACCRHRHDPAGGLASGPNDAQDEPSCPAPLLEQPGCLKEGAGER